MNSQTARRPEGKRPTRSAKTNKYVRQTAHVEARRDGKPFVFGWGGHLSRNEKIQLQRRAVWTASIGIAVLIVAVIIGFWVNINIITPGLPITSVNGHNIPQSDYRKLLALKAQLELNKIKGLHGLEAQRDALKKQVDAQQKTIDDTTKQIDTLNTQIKALPAGDSSQRTNLNNQLTTAKKKLADTQKTQDDLNKQYQNIITSTLPLEQQFYTQSQQSNESATWLQDDELIREWLANQGDSTRAKIEPSSTALDNAIKDFSANFPKGSSYNKFLSDDHVSDADMHAMMALKLRRDNMQTYLASLVTSPTYQVLARAMTLSTEKDANDVLNQLKKGADFGKLAKDKSVDPTTKDKGGSLGWLARGQYTQNYANNTSALVDNWLFDPSRKLNELSPVLSEGGTFHIVQILGIDPSRDVDKDVLQSLKDKARDTWLLEQRALPGTKITSPDQDKLNDASNLPPGLPTAAPGQTPGSSGASG